jgi:hypothetical protein
VFTIMLETSPATGIILKKICVSNAIRMCKKISIFKHQMQTHAIRTQRYIQTVNYTKQCVGLSEQFLNFFVCIKFWQSDLPLL